jgi:hypothetical protein
VQDGPVVSPDPPNKTANNVAVNVLRTVAAVLVVMGHARALFFLDYAEVPHNLVTAAFYLVTGLGYEAAMVFSCSAASGWAARC